MKTADVRRNATEAEIAAVALADKDAALEKKVQGLEDQARRLTESLAAVRAEADLLRSRVEPAELKKTVVPREDTLMAGESRIVDVDADLRMAVINAGAEQGVKPGMVFGVMRGEKAVAMVRAVDVRRNVTGAVMMDTPAGELPAKGDKVIFRRGSENLIGKE